MGWGFNTATVVNSNGNYSLANDLSIHYAETFTHRYPARVSVTNS